MIETLQEINCDEIDMISGGATSLWYDIGYYIGKAHKYFEDLPGGVEVWQGS